MELRRYLVVLRRRLPLVIACAVIGLVAAYATLPRGALYQASTTIYVGNREFANQGSLSNDQTIGVESVARTFAVMIASPPIARDALDRTSLQRSDGQVTRRTTAAVIAGTSLIRVTYRDSDPTAARLLANALSDALVAKVQDYEPGTAAGEGTVPTLPAYVFARADLPLAPAPTGALGHLVTGVVFGLVVAGALAFLLEYLDITPRSAEDLERHLGLPVLGEIPLLPDSVAHRSLVRPTTLHSVEDADSG